MNNTLGDVENCWRTVFIMTDVFAEVARFVAKELEYEYNIEEEKAGLEFLKIVKELPKGAKDFR